MSNDVLSCNKAENVYNALCINNLFILVGKEIHNEIQHSCIQTYLCGKWVIKKITKICQFEGCVFW